MPEPLIFISTHRVAEGALEEVRRLGAEFVRSAETDEPHTVGLHLFLDPDGSRLTYLHIQRDAEGMDRHLQLSRERIARVVEVAPTSSITVYGTPGPVLTHALGVNAEAGAVVNVVPGTLGGFLRTAAA